MTREYALVRLLELGPLTLAELCTVTGWKEKEVRETISSCRDRITFSNMKQAREGNRVYLTKAQTC